MTLELDRDGQDLAWAAHSAWGEWLGSREWDVWFTHTFRPERDRWGLELPIGSRYASRCLRHWLRDVRELVGGRHQLDYFGAHEIGPSSGRLHLHGLVRGIDDVPLKYLWQLWYQRHGRCQVLRYDPARGAAHYVAKYMAKDIDVAHVDWHFSQPCEPGPLFVAQPSSIEHAGAGQGASDVGQDEVDELRHVAAGGLR